jgi:hypothetical protein
MKMKSGEHDQATEAYFYFIIFNFTAQLFHRPSNLIICFSFARKNTAIPRKPEPREREWSRERGRAGFFAVICISPRLLKIK